MQRGASKSPAWDAVETLECVPNTTNRKVKCLYCGEIRTLGASAVVRHLQTAKCTREARGHPPPPGKPAHAEMVKALQDYCGRSAHKRRNSSSDGPKNKQVRLSFRPQMSPQDADDCVLQGLVAAALPLSLVDNLHFRAMIEGLAAGVRPQGSHASYRAPTRQRLSTKVLERVYEAKDAAQRSRVFAYAKEYGVTVSMDGKTCDAQKTSLLNVVAQTSRGAVLLDVANVSGQTKDRAFVIKFITSAIERELQDIGGIFAVNEIVMDGANRHFLPHLRRAIVDLRREKDEARAAACMAPVASTCVAHTLNLLMGDVYKHCDDVRAVIDSAKELVVFFRSRDKIRTMLRGKDIPALMLPSDVRFGSYFLMARRLVKVREQLRGVCVSREWETWKASLTIVRIREKADRIERMCLDTSGSLWEPLKVIVDVWSVMHKVLRVFDGLQARLYMLYPLYKGMEAEIECILASEESAVSEESVVSEDFAGVVRDRLSVRYVYLQTHTPAFLLAHFLDPHFMDQPAPRDATLVFQQFCRESGVDVGKRLFVQGSDFRTGTGMCALHRDKEMTKRRVQWWTVPPEGLDDLASVAKRIMSLTGTATECERGWKDWTNVVTLRRNKLHHDRATKLVKLYHHMHKREKVRVKESAPPDIVFVSAGDATAAAAALVPGDDFEESGNDFEESDNAVGDIRRIVIGEGGDSDESGGDSSESGL